MRALTAAVLAAALGGCTTVKLSQRDGCWVRKTEGFLRGEREELGPCARPQPPWVEDRLARLVQECEARADYRWQSRALAAWSRGEKQPEHESDSAVLQDCMSQATRAMLAENDAMKQKMSEVVADRDALKARLDDERKQSQATLDDERKRYASTLDDERAHLHATTDKLAEALGQAASKPIPPATATASATSEGSATTDQTSSAEPAPVAVVAATPLAVAPEKGKAARRGRAAKPAALRVPAAGCDVPAASAASAARPAAPREGAEAVPAAELPAKAP